MQIVPVVSIKNSIFKENEALKSGGGLAVGESIYSFVNGIRYIRIDVDVSSSLFDHNHARNGGKATVT